MTGESPTGIPNPDRPGHWLVPPWPHDAGFSDIVAHFLRFTPCDDLSPAGLLTYFEGYQSVLESPGDQRRRHPHLAEQPDQRLHGTVHRLLSMPLRAGHLLLGERLGQVRRLPDRPGPRLVHVQVVVPAMIIQLADQLETLPPV